MCMQGNFGPRPEPPPEITLKLFEDGVTCPTCGMQHDVGLEEEKFVCVCGTPIHAIFAPCLNVLMQ